MADPETFYDDLAAHHHLIFADWSKAITRQATILDRLIGAGPRRRTILDCACGIGTQALGLAARGHRVTGSDLSPGAIARAELEARRRGLRVSFQVADLRHLDAVAGRFEVVLALDNALPHLLTEADLAQAVEAMAAKLTADGLLLVSIRDYDRLLIERPSAEAPRFLDGVDGRRIVHQVWDWLDQRCYRLHLHITCEQAGGWVCHHHVGLYRALRRAELGALLDRAGLVEMAWLMPEETGFHQPIVRARKP